VYELKAEQQAHAAKLLELTQQTPRKPQHQQQEMVAGQAMSGFMAGLLLASKTSSDKMHAALGEQLGKAQETVEKLRQQAEEAAAAVSRERQLVEKLREEARNSAEASRCAAAAPPACRAALPRPAALLRLGQPCPAAPAAAGASRARRGAAPHRAPARAVPRAGS
jgi:hypothetical protein